MEDDTHSTSNECLIETVPEYTEVTASKAGREASVYNLLESGN